MYLGSFLSTFESFSFSRELVNSSLVRIIFPGDFRHISQLLGFNIVPISYSGNFRNSSLEFLSFMRIFPLLLYLPAF
jgi:hypothetical protein